MTTTEIEASTTTIETHADKVARITAQHGAQNVYARNPKLLPRSDCVYVPFRRVRTVKQDPTPGGSDHSCEIQSNSNDLSTVKLTHLLCWVSGGKSGIGEATASTDPRLPGVLGFSGRAHANSAFLGRCYPDAQGQSEFDEFVAYPVVADGMNASMLSPDNKANEVEIHFSPEGMFQIKRWPAGVCSHSAIQDVIRAVDAESVFHRGQMFAKSSVTNIDPYKHTITLSSPPKQYEATAPVVASTDSILASATPPTL